VTAAFKIHTKLGPGLFESVYQTVLVAELENAELHVECEKEVPIIFEGRRFEKGFRADIIVEKSVLVEVKSVRKLDPVFAKQTITYLRLTDLRVGLLINFGAPHLRDAIKRFVNKLEEK
jgi:GxxExxY protein